MTNIKQFIEDALNGGFESAVLEEHLTELNNMGFITIHTVGWLFLVPDVWRAVSKTRNWNEGKRTNCPTCTPGKISVDWRYYMHQFVEHIAMGRTIEESLKSLNTPPHEKQNK